jgi:tetratricopeptide (TPR) repeat protein/ADP-heptose:LPS heptosyltransferase
MSINKTIQLAFTHYNRGDLKHEESLCKKILKKQPNNTDALHKLGIINYKFGNYDMAIKYIRKVLQLNPENACAYYNLGNTYRKKGQLDEATICYQKSINLDPKFADSYYGLGYLLQENGQYDEAIIAYKKALEINPAMYNIYYNMGNIFRDKGQLDEAILHYKKTIQLNPGFEGAYRNLGNIFQQKGLFDESIEFYQKVLQLNPNLADVYSSIGSVLTQKGKLNEAITYYQKALQLDPNYTAAYNDIGIILIENGKFEEASSFFMKAIELEPGFALAHNNLGTTLQYKGLSEKALFHYRKAIEIDPAIADAYNNIGGILKDKGQIDEAVEYFQKALQLNPAFAEAYNNIGIVLSEKGNFDEAITYYQKAIKLKPHLSNAHLNMSFIMLSYGDFNNGWKEYEWRLKINAPYLKDFSQLLWDGSDISGKTILLYTEQGYGDAIQFIRYVPLVVQRGATIIVECQKELVSLFQNVEGIEQVISIGEQLPAFDVHCPLLSLSLKFNTTIDTIPAEIPYIKVNPFSIQKWKDKLSDDNLKLKVGLVWAGSRAHKNDRNRSFSLDTFAPLAQFDNVVFYSLQKGDGSEQAKSPPDGMKFIDYTDEIHDFSDTATLIMNLDLVISVDTAVAHLAGALGKTVWTLVTFAPDWRWMLNREDSPWYPTMRLFRQPSYGNWKSVIDNVKEKLQLFIKEKLPASSTKDKSAYSYANYDNSVKPAPQNPCFALPASQSEAVEERGLKGSGADGREMKKLPDEDDFYQTGEDMLKQKETVAIILRCEGIGDCLFAIAVIKKLHLIHKLNHKFVIFTHHPELFIKCPYIEKAYNINNTPELTPYQKRIVLFDTSKMPHWMVDTFDFISIPAGIGELSFREKQLEYFPIEEDHSEHYDVVINTSVTWPSRSWPVENWQKVADFILAQGYSIAVVGKDTFSKADNMWKRSQRLKGCADLTNKLSLDQTYFTIKNCDLFITCQNGLSVLSGATDMEIIVLDMSIEWSKRAIYRNEDPHYKVTYVKGNCKLYCCSSFECPMYTEFRCIPTVEQVLEVVREKLSLIKKM